MDKSLIFLLLLLPSLAFAQTHTMPGNNVVPGGANLTIKSGGSIIADPGSTIVGFGSGGGTALTAGSGIDITSDVISVDKTLFTLQPVNTAPTLDSIMLMYNPLLDQMQQLAFSDFAANLSINSVTDPITGKKLFFGTSALTADRHFNSPDADTIGVISQPGATANQFVTFISGGGVQNHAQPSISNLSDAGQLAGWASITPATGVAAFLATPNSAAFRTMLTDENNPDGLTAKVIMANGSLSIASGKTLTSANTLTLQGTDGSSINIGTGGTLGSAAFTNGNHVYSAASPPTTDVGMFTISRTGVDLKTAGNTTVFTVPAGRAFVCTGAVAVVTSVTTPGAGTENFQIKESGTTGLMTAGGASASGTPAVGIYYAETIIGSAGPFTQCAAGNNVFIAVAASQAGSTSVTGTVFVNGFYTQ